jgi:tetratricopeptide (TPR) repeat protein
MKPLPGPNGRFLGELHNRRKAVHKNCIDLILDRPKIPRSGFEMTGSGQHKTLPIAFLQLSGRVDRVARLIVRHSREISRATLCSVGLALAWGGSVGGQGLPDQNTLCGDPNPDISIGGCTAIIQSGRGAGGELAVAHNERGVAYVALQDYDRALQDFSAAIKFDPKFSQAWANRGAVHGARQDFDLAIQDFSRVVVLDPGSSHAFYDRASMYRLIAQNDAALRDYTEAIKLDPKFLDAVLHRGITLAGTKRCREAIADFTRAIELNPEQAIAYVDRGVCYEASGRDDLALEDFSAHLRLDSRSFYGLDRRAAVYFRAGQYDRALADYSQALLINPNAPSALYGSGVVKRMMGDLRGGDTDIATATTLRPGIAEHMSARGVKP